MNTRAKSMRDAYAFSLRGLSAKSPFVMMPAIADDRIRKAQAEGSGRPQDDQPNTAGAMKFLWGRFWLRALRRAA